VAKILKARDQGGPFLEVFDLARRTRLNRAQMDALRQAGALATLLRQAA
jgi:DNA polymerase III alpha subunit (gram-positive type)